MKNFQLFVQFAAMIMLMVHSFVPHSHHSELSFEEHEREHLEARSFGDFLALALHFDHPEGQLEDYASAESLSVQDDFGSDQVLVSVLPQFEFHTDSNRSQNHFNLDFSSQENHSPPNSLRGPPYLS